MTRRNEKNDSTPESVQRASLTLQRVDDVQSRHGSTPRVFRVGDRVADDVIQKDLEDPSRLFVDQSGDALDSAATSETTDGRLGNALDVVAKHLSVTLGASLSQSFSSAGHVFFSWFFEERVCERRRRRLSVRRRDDSPFVRSPRRRTESRRRNPQNSKKTRRARVDVLTHTHTHTHKRYP